MVFLMPTRTNLAGLPLPTFSFSTCTKLRLQECDAPGEDLEEAYPCLNEFLLGGYLRGLPDVGIHICRLPPLQPTSLRNRGIEAGLHECC